MNNRDQTRPADNYAERFRLARLAAKAERQQAKARRKAHEANRIHRCPTCHLDCSRPKSGTAKPATIAGGSCMTLFYQAYQLLIALENAQERFRRANDRIGVNHLERLRLMALRRSVDASPCCSDRGQRSAGHGRAPLLPFSTRRPFALYVTR